MWTVMKKKHIFIIATGGTIAGSAAAEIATTGYAAGAIGINELLAAVPEVKNIADVSGEELAAIDSKDITQDLQLKLVYRCQELLASDSVDGIVITHGTDTMEETAYLLSLLINSKKPVVLTGAMRPATAISADGPLNLLDAVRVAINDKTLGQGVLIVMNNHIDGAHDAIKSHTMAVDTFISPNFGSLGDINDGKVNFLRQTVYENLPIDLNKIKKITKLPAVCILYAYAGDNGQMVQAAIASGFRGIIYAGMGNGSIPKQVEMELKKAVQTGIMVVRSTRCPRGCVASAEESYNEAGFIEGNTLNPAKARILLQLALVQGKDKEEIQTWFNKY